MKVSQCPQIPSLTHLTIVNPETASFIFLVHISPYNSLFPTTTTPKVSILPEGVKGFVMKGIKGGTCKARGGMGRLS